MEHKTIIEIYEAIGSRIVIVFVFAFGLLGWATAFRFWNKLTDYAKRLGRENEL